MKASEKMLRAAGHIEDHANTYWDNPDCDEAVAERAQAARLRKKAALLKSQAEQGRAFIYAALIILAVYALWVIALNLTVFR